MARIEDAGGAVAAIERGFQKDEIERSAYQVTREIDARERVIVGVNKFTRDDGDDEPYQPLRVDPAIEEAQSARLAALRAGRDDAAVKRGLDELRTAAEGSANVLYPLRSALQASATVGEVCDALREVWGTYQPPDAH
jgi:methylmalonyl-CoA mutase N-terminal domain/subunit